MTTPRYETDNWPRIQAKFYTHVKERRDVRLVVIHAMQFRESPLTAEIIAKDFQTRSASQKGSSHLCIDNNSIIQCVLDNDVAFAAPGANHDGIQIELAGFAEQTREQWLDEYGLEMLALAADASAQYCLKYGIPPKHLNDLELRNGARGLVGHDQVTRVYHRSDHTDPGKGFPWDWFVAKVQKRVSDRRR